MDRVAEDLKVRTKYFAVRVLEFVETLPRTPGADAVARQFARAAVGVVGNYRSSCRARSHAEFTARLGIVLDEADESELWTEISEDRKWGDPAMRAWLLNESRQLRAIFSKGVMTAKSKERRP
ncbi:MAG: four helix bundle protein [Acidobacteria bacterium]|nr:four helix bundle protein [Acidobacteriota bacterium]